MKKKEFRENSLRLVAFAIICMGLISCGDDDNNNTDRTEGSGYIDNHAYVDLGLSVKWATMNVGAVNSPDVGSYFAWGEVAEKEDYSWATYKWANGTETSMTKYCVDSSYGTIDNKSVLEKSDDAASVNWGGSWRMPTDNEWRELKTQCTWTWYGPMNTEFLGVMGYKVQSRVEGNSNYIFLPYSGFYSGTNRIFLGESDGEYWSSSLSQRNFEALVCWFLPDDHKPTSLLNGGRCEGRPVRAVHP